MYHLSLLIPPPLLTGVWYQKLLVINTKRFVIPQNTGDMSILIINASLELTHSFPVQPFSTP